MAVLLPSGPVEAALPPRRRRRIPGLALIQSTHGLQRAMLITGLVMMAIFILVALFAPLLAPYGFNDDRAGGVIFGTQQPPSAAHWLGTTVGGQDVLSRVIYGARTAMEVILLAVAVSLVIGVPLGLASGYLGGWLDRVLVLITDALYSFPSLLLAIIVSIMVSGGQSSAFGGILSAAISITVIFIPQYFRVVRNATVQAKVEPYVDAARVAGAKPGRIMFGHILANVSQTIPVLGTLNASEAILTLAGLGFLGFGIEPSSAAEWGYDLNKALPDATNGIWWTGIFPGLAIVLVVTGVTLIGESLNDILNPLLRTRGGATTADEREIAAVAPADAALQSGDIGKDSLWQLGADAAPRGPVGAGPAPERLADEPAWIDARGTDDAPAAPPPDTATAQDEGKDTPSDPVGTAPPSDGEGGTAPSSDEGDEPKGERL